MKIDNWQNIGRLTIFGLNGGCTSRASTFSQSILLKLGNWKIDDVFSGRIIVTLNLEIYDIIVAGHIQISLQSMGVWCQTSTMVPSYKVS